MGLYLFCRQIYDAGVNSDHVKDVRQAAFESTKAAVRRLSMKCANQERSSVMSKSQTSKKKKEGRVSPELRYINFKVKPPPKNKKYENLRSLSCKTVTMTRKFGCINLQ